MQVVQRGYFVDWQQPTPSQAQPMRMTSSEPSKPATVPRTVPVPDSMASRPAHTQGLVAINAQARAEAGGYGPRMSESISVLGR